MIASKSPVIFSYFDDLTDPRMDRVRRHLERLDDGLASPTSTLTSRSLGMICSVSSFLPRGIACPPLVVTPPDYLSVIIPF